MRIICLAILAGFLAGCSTTSDYFDGCYDRMIQQYGNENDAKLGSTGGFIFTYQKRYAEAVCKYNDDVRNEQRRRNRNENSPRR